MARAMHLGYTFLMDTLAIVGMSALQIIRGMRESEARIERTTLPSPEGLVSGVRQAERLGVGMDAAGEHPLCLLAPRGAVRSRSPRAKLMTWTGEIPPDSFMRMDGLARKAKPGQILVASPELCALTMARELDLPQLVLLVSELCGDFSVCSDGDAFVPRPPISTIERIEGYVRASAGAYAVDHLRRALAWSAGGAFSPMEAIVRVWLCLDVRLGGFGCGRPETNMNVSVGEGYGAGTVDNVVRYLDLGWRDRFFGVECDGGQHDASSDAFRDIQLGRVGFRERRITWRQMSSYNTACAFGGLVRQELGLSSRPTDTPAYAGKRLRLWKSLVSSPWAALQMRD